MFTEQERKIYLSPQQVAFDPVDLYNRLVLAVPDFANTLNRWWGEEAKLEDKAQASLLLAKGARAVFGFKPFNQQGGVLDAVVLETLYHFLGWREKKG